MTVLIIIACIIVLLCIACRLLAGKFASTVVHPNVHTYEYSRRQVMEHCDIDPYKVLDNHKVEEFSYRSEFGYNLYGRIIRANEDTHFPDGRERVVILCHGWTSNQITMLTYGLLYQKLGFSIVAYDHRYHGKSDRSAHCTMGLCESRDLIGLAQYVKQFFPENAVWGIQGESMGSATAMQAAPEIRDLSFLVQDCGYSSMRKEMAATLKNAHLPSFPILNMGSAVLKKKYGLDMDKVNAETAIADLDIPMLFCQGDNDTFVPTAMIYDLYGAKKDKKEMHLFEGSRHAESIWDHTAEYGEVLRGFLEKYGII